MGAVQKTNLSTEFEPLFLLHHIKMKYYVKLQNISLANFPTFFASDSKILAS